MGRRLRGILATAVAILALIPVDGFAQSDHELAGEVAKEAVTQYRSGNFEEAGKLFAQAYELSGRATQLRNAGKAYEAANMLEEAIVFWERYRRHEEIDRDERAEAEAHIGLIQERKKNQDALKAVEVATAAAESASRDAESARADAAEARRVASVQPERPPNTLAWVGVAGGAAMVATGSVVWVLQSLRLSDLDRRLGQRDRDGKITGITPQQKDDEVSAINSQRLLSGVLFGVGASAAIGGLTWILSGAQAGAERTALVPGGPGMLVVDGGGLLTWGGQW